MINVKEIKEILHISEKIFIENKDFLIQLDSQFGDGDLGITMSEGAKNVCKVVNDYTDADIGKLLANAGMTLAKTVPSTMGTLSATAFMSAGKAVNGKTEINQADIAAMLEAAVDGVTKRGKSKPGDKTMLDSLSPAAKAAQTNKELALPEMLEKIYFASQEGAESTVGMVPVHGRGMWHKDEAKMQKDPGAFAVSLFFKALYIWAKN